MVENGGRILEHDELLDKVWAGTFVEQATLKKGISALRQILGENSENEYIKTIPRRGYSFISPVHIVPEEKQILFVRETEQETIVEEFEEIDNDNFSQNVLEIPSTELKSLPAPEPQKTNFTRIAIISAAGVAAVLLLLFGLKPFFSKAAQSQFSVENVRVNRITNSGKILGGSTISPDGTYLLYPAAEKSGVSLWLRQMSTNSTSRLTPPVDGNFWGFGVAPDNSYVYYILNSPKDPRASGLYKIPLLGGEPRKINENIGSFAVSPDGKRIALVRTTDKINIFTVNSDGEDEKPVIAFSGDMRLWGLSWTPDGSALLGTFRKTVNDKPLFYISEIAPDTGKETIILPVQEKYIFGAVWLPDKNSILLTMREANADIRQIWQYFPASQDWRRVTNDNNSYKYVSLTRDGKTIISDQQSRLAAIWIAEGLALDQRTPEKTSLLSNSGSFRQITDGVNNLDKLSWLANGRLTYSTTDSAKETIFSINADGTTPRQVTNGEDGIWIFPKAAGNGQSIGFLSSRAGSRQLWRVDEDGKNLTRMTQTDAPLVNALILRDNITVLYTVRHGKETVLFKQAAGGETTQLTDSDTGLFAVSADEKLLAVETTDKNTGKFHVELRSFADGSTIKTFDFSPDRQMIFAPDGKNLTYDTPRGDSNQIMVQPLDGSPAFALTDFQSDSIFSFDWSGDGAHLAVIRGKQLDDAVLIKTVER